MRSKFEEKINLFLNRNRIKYTYENISVNYTVECSYIPDFYIEDTNIIVEAKGYFSPADRKKMLLVKKQNPHLDIRILFQNSNVKISKKSKTTYGQWASKNGFIWHCSDAGVLPREWLNKDLND